MAKAKPTTRSTEQELVQANIESLVTIAVLFNSPASVNKTNIHEMLWAWEVVAKTAQRNIAMWKAYTESEEKQDA
jgi:hypothetical protein